MKTSMKTSMTTAARRGWAGAASLVLVASGAAWLGLGTTTSTVAGPDDGSAAAERARAALGLRTVSSMAEAERLAAAAGLRGETLKVVTHEMGWQYVDLPPKGDSKGDFFWSTGKLYNPAHTKVIGRQALRCEFTSVSVGAPWCEQPLKINGRGKLILSNPVLGGNDTVAITGGTREFAEARGQAKLTVLENGHTFDIAFVIDLR